MSTTPKKNAEENESFLRRVDWTSIGIKLGGILVTSYLSGYVGALASDSYHERKLKKIAKKEGSNVIPMKKVG